MPAMYQTATVGPLRFAQPLAWSREVSETDHGLSVSLQSPGVSFAVLGLYDASREPEDVADQVLDSLRQEHPSLDAEDWDAPPFKHADGVTLEAMFLSLDVVSYGWIRSWRLGDRVALVFLQSVEPEAEEQRPVFVRLCCSLTVVAE